MRTGKEEKRRGGGDRDRPRTSEGPNVGVAHKGDMGDKGDTAPDRH